MPPDMSYTVGFVASVKLVENVLLRADSNCGDGRDIGLAITLLLRYFWISTTATDILNDFSPSLFK